MPETIFELVADTLGISSSVVKIILFMGLSAFSGVGLLIFTGSTVLSILASSGIIILGTLTGVFPVWLALLVGFFSLAYILYTRFFEGGVFNGQRTSLAIGAIIAIMISIVVGVNLIPAVLESINTTTVEPGTATSKLIGVLPYVFVAVIILGAVAWMGGAWGGSDEKKEVRRQKVRAFFGNAREVILRVEKSSKNWSQYINNLDDLLGIKTINDTNAGSQYGLSLNEDKELYIHPAFDWYVADKHPTKDIFKVVGLHKEDASLNLVYLLGIDDTEHKPFLIKVPAPEVYLEASCKSCLDAITQEKVVAV